MTIGALNPEQFGEDHETPLEHYGISVIPAWQEKHYRKTHPYEIIREDRDVGIASLRGGQHYVDTKRVHDIAAKGENDIEESQSARPHGVELPDGSVMLQDGHHRTAAQTLRGSPVVRVHVAGKYHLAKRNQFDPKGLHDECE